MPVVVHVGSTCLADCQALRGALRRDAKLVIVGGAPYADELHLPPLRIVRMMVATQFRDLKSFIENGVINLGRLATDGGKPFLKVRGNTALLY